MEVGLLEDWLQRAASSVSNPPSSSSSPSPSAQQIAQAWSQVRACAKTRPVLPQHSVALGFLRQYRSSIHVSESQARLLLSILWSVDGGGEEFLVEARSSASLLLSIWLRRGSAFASSGRHGSNSVKDILEAVLTSAAKAVEGDVGCVGETILLLGSVCINPHALEDQKKVCQELIARECGRQRKSIGGERRKEALAGIGYAMVTSSGPTLKALIQALLLLWIDDEILGPISGQIATRPSLENGLLHLHLMEWYGSFLHSQPNRLASLEIVAKEFREAFSSGIAASARYGVLLSAAGLLRSFHFHRSTRKPAPDTPEAVVVAAIETLNNAVLKLIDDATYSQGQAIAGRIDAGTFVDATIEENQTLLSVGVGDKHWWWSMSLAISRCGHLPPSLPVLVCLTATFFEDILPLGAIYNENLLHQSMDKLAVHTKSVLFQEAGAIIRVICEQYKSADKGWQGWVECLFIKYSHFFYAKHRYYKMLMDNKEQNASINVVPYDDIGPLKPILEAFLLSLVVFFSRASEMKIILDVHTKGHFGAQVLQSLSCVECIRQAPVPAYRELMQRCVTWVSANETTCAMSLYMFPPFDEITKLPGPGISCYSWKQDHVQDSRILFGFRVLPSCLQTFPAAQFLNNVAPIIFLYMKHPTQALVQASHSLLVSFFSTKSREKDRESTKEKLAVQFVMRTFEGGSDLPNYDTFVTVVGAIARHLPAGSKATKECVTFLSQKASDFFSLGVTKREEDRLETGKKLQTLLFHLILIVDVQVLPHLLQEVARLVLGQTNPYRMHALEEAFDVLAGSDDLTRKHVLVPWLQSLSFLCSNSPEQTRPSTTKSRRQKRQSRNSFGIEVDHSDGVVAFNPSIATMSASNDVSQTARSQL